MIHLTKEEPSNVLDGRWPKTTTIDREVYEQVFSIVEDVRRRGDKAIVEYTEKFDKVKLSPEEVRVEQDEIEEAYKKVSVDQIEALREAKKRLELVEIRRLGRLSLETYMKGIKIFHRVRPIRNVGCYVPGGHAAYPSSLVMCAVPANVAGVPEVTACTPPRKDGKAAPLTIVAADVCGVNNLYKIGGVQAIAALAYGSDYIKPVMKIVGPGNKYVTAAKNIVSRDVAVDKPAGPTEIIILADELANPRLIALDLISQAEHGKEGISGLVTTSQSLAEKVVEALKEQVKKAYMSNLILEAFSEGGFIYVCPDENEAVSFVNRLAPEHLEIHMEEPMVVAEQITSAGLILLGPYTPVSATDYCMGVNHVLPTKGYGKIYSGLSVLDFVRTVEIIHSSREGLKKVKSKIKTLSETEGLPNHFLAVEGRFRL